MALIAPITVDCPDCGLTMTVPVNTTISDERSKDGGKCYVDVDPDLTEVVDP